MSELGFANPAEKSVGQLILRLWALQFFQFSENNYMWALYFRLDSAFGTMRHFGTGGHAKRKVFGLSAWALDPRRQSAGNRLAVTSIVFAQTIGAASRRRSFSRTMLVQRRRWCGPGRPSRRAARIVSSFPELSVGKLSESAPGRYEASLPLSQF